MITKHQLSLHWSRPAPVQVQAHKWSTSGGIAYSFSSQNSSEFAIEPDSAPPRSIAAPGPAELRTSAAVYTAVPHTSLVVTGGHYDNSVRVFQLHGGTLLQAAVAHSRPVSCVAVASGALSRSVSGSV